MGTASRFANGRGGRHNVVRVALTAIALLTFECAALFGQNATLDRLKTLVDIAYPQLLGHRTPISLTVLSTLDSNYLSGVVSLSVRPDGDGEQDATTTEPFLRGFIDLGDGRFIQDAQFSGRYLHSRVVTDVRAAVEAHPEWTIVDVERALIQAAAKFPPSKKDAFAQHAAIDRYSAAIGHFEIVRIEFRWHQPNVTPPGAQVVPVAPTWVIVVRGTAESERTTCHGLFFEPIDGRLTGLNRFPCG